MQKQHNEHEVKCSTNTATVPTDANDAEFDLLKRVISTKALRLLKQQLDYAMATNFDNSKACSRAFTAKWGLPCKHFLHHRIHQTRTAQKDPKAIYYLKLSQIDQHWHLDPPRARGITFAADDDIFRPLDPLKVKSKGRPKGATSKQLPKPKNGKRLPYEARNLSSWEYLQAKQDAAWASQTAPKKRIIKKKVTTTVTEEETLLDPHPLSSLNAATITRFQDMLQAAMYPLQQQVAVLEGRLKKDIVDISSDNEDSNEDNNEDNDGDNNKAENQLSDEEYPSPKRVKAVQSTYGTRSKTPKPSLSNIQRSGGYRG
ncbi:hypothetical protein EJ02DRAFT_428506 [Clathrospora elynae]|uniref:Uncharacterized protein n=1 Tax=Clathrospora elynae TaxID=706981 RepID=A0A6A5S7I4_9PLEO|nr:hypothetical protein EJ02DRAFT_428506 [Clathrospora elynae]